MEQKKKTDRSGSIQRMAPAFLMIGLMVILAIANKNFLSMQSIYNLLLQVSALGVVGLGAMVVLLTGGIDFTGGFGLSLAGVTAGALYVAWGSQSVVLLVTAIAIGAAVGLVNGLIIVKLRLNPFIATLATMSVCKGVSMMVSEGRQVKIVSPFLLQLGSGKIAGVLPWSFVAFMLVAALMYVLMNNTKLGVYTYAMGGNEDAVAYSGINKGLYKVLVYVLAGSCYGFAAVLTSCQVTVITPNISGDFLMDGIAAAVVGGTSMAGGKGTVQGVVVGAFIITLITTMLNFFKVPMLLRDVIKGLIIIGILLFGVVIDKMSSRREAASP